jgi:L-amino acid N-acyltransferase YncA
LLLDIREATLGDADAIVQVLNPIIESGLYTVLDTLMTADSQREFIRDFPTRGLFLVAVDQIEGRVVGFQSLAPFAEYTHAFDHVGELGTYVDLRCRRQGIAGRLFEAMFSAAPRKGYEKFFTFVRADNPVALQTYLHHGFTVIGTAARQAKIRGQYIDETLIEKMLTP